MSASFAHVFKRMQGRSQSHVRRQASIFSRGRPDSVAIGTWIFTTMGLITAAPGYAEENEHEPTCTLKTLQGRYLFGGVTTLLPPAVMQQSLLAVAGYRVFNGDGTGTDIVTVSIDGAVVLENFVTPMSYTVKPDCTGTVTILAAGESFGAFIAPNGTELIAIGTTPGSVSVTGPSRRVSRK